MPVVPETPAPAYLGRYQVLARLGSGGMAEVFLARSEGPAGFQKRVAIKRMKPELTESSEFVDLFLGEARTAAMLSHPNICHVHELCSEAGDYFMVMEYLEGIPLTRVLARQLRSPSTFPLHAIVGMVEHACLGMDHAHSLSDSAGRPYNIVHRDVSPPNLFVTTSGVVKVLDFGISKSRESVVQTVTGQIRGKFSYMSPEQLNGERLDRRSDVFALGIVLFELVAGQRLFKRRTRLETFRAVTQRPIPRLDQVCKGVPPPLVDAVARALARDRDRRLPSASALADLLRSALADQGGPAAPHQITEVIDRVFRDDLAAQRTWLEIAETGNSPHSQTATTRSAVDVDPTVRDAPGIAETAATTAAVALRPGSGRSDQD